MKKFNSLSDTMKAAYITGTATIIAALIGGIFLLKGTYSNQSTPIATASVTATITLLGNVTSTITSTYTPTPTATATANSYGGTLSIDDPLKDNSKGYSWDETKAHCTFTGGAYHVTTSQPIGYECNTNSSFTDLSNFSYQITMTIEKGSQGGICFRFTVNNQAGYCFVLDLNGNYVLETVNYDNLKSLVRGQNMYFNTGLGKPNQIAARAIGNEIDLFINGHLVNSAQNSSFSDGQIGVFIGYTGSFTDVEFTDAKIWVV